MTQAWRKMERKQLAVVLVLRVVQNLLDRATFREFSRTYDRNAADKLCH